VGAVGGDTPDLVTMPKFISQILQGARRISISYQK
jgi:hypothetical protein